MDILKVGLVMAAGLGSTWVARATTDALLGPPRPQMLMQAGEQTPGQATPAAEAPAASPPAVPEMSREEMDAELKRAQAEIVGKPAPGDTEEFRPTKPLPADLPISLPSDI